MACPLGTTSLKRSVTASVNWWSGTPVHCGTCAATPRGKSWRLDLGTITDSSAQAILRRYRESGVAVAVWETTSDVALPCFDCLIIDRELNPLRPLPGSFGAGCHPCREVALLRALTEAAQSRLTSISGSRDDIDRAGHSRAHEWETLCELHEFIIGHSGERSIVEAPSYFLSTLD